MDTKLPYRLNSAHIFVRDLQAARRFYVEVMGMPLQFESDQYLGLDTGECGLMVFEDPEKTSTSTATCLHFGVDDIRRSFAELSKKGVRFEGEPQLHDWGGTMVSFSDSDGNVLHLVQYPS